MYLTQPLERIFSLLTLTRRETVVVLLYFAHVDLKICSYLQREQTGRNAKEAANLHQLEQTVSGKIYKKQGSE